MMPSSCLLMLHICPGLSNIIKTYVRNKHNLTGRFIILALLFMQVTLFMFLAEKPVADMYFCFFLPLKYDPCLFEGNNPTYPYLISLWSLSARKTTDPFKTSLGIRPHSFQMMTHGIVLWWMFGETWQTVGATMLLLGSQLADTLWHGK